MGIPMMNGELFPPDTWSHGAATEELSDAMQMILLVEIFYLDLRRWHLGLGSKVWRSEVALMCHHFPLSSQQSSLDGNEQQRDAW